LKEKGFTAEDDEREETPENEESAEGHSLI